MSLRVSLTDDDCYHLVVTEDSSDFVGLQFRNYYAMYLTVSMLREGEGENSSDSWMEVYSTQLMADGHYENDAQKYHTIYVDQFNGNYRHKAPVKHFKLHISQPSCMWKKFEIHDISLVTVAGKRGEGVSLNPLGSPSRYNSKACGDGDRVSAILSSRGKERLVERVAQEGAGLINSIRDLKIDQIHRRLEEPPVLKDRSTNMDRKIVNIGVMH